MYDTKLLKQQSIPLSLHRSSVSWKVKLVSHHHFEIFIHKKFVSHQPL